MAACSPVPLAMQPAVAASPPGQSSKIHDAALRMLASLGAAIAKRPSAALSSALRAVAGKLGDVEPMSMLGDLRTPSVPSGETVPATLLKAVASSTKSKKFAAAQALDQGSLGGWVSAKLPDGKSSFLVTLAAPMHLSGIRFAFDKSRAPATVEVLAEDANSGTVVRMLEPASGSLFMEPVVVPFGLGIFSGRVVIRMSGSAKAGKDHAVHSLRSLAVGRFVTPPPPASGQMGSVVGSVAAMLAESCHGSDSSLRDAAMLALCNLYKATASASVGMLLLNVLSGISKDLSPLALQAVRDTVRVVNKSMFAACASLKDPGAGGAGGGWSPVSAKFAKIHSSARLRAGGSRLYSNSSDTWGQVNVGMSSGVHQWEMTVTEDSSGGECTCLGVSVASPRDTSYEHQSSFLLVRCFNGTVYNFGSSDASVEKIHPKDKVRFELDMDRGTLRCWIRGKDQGIIGKDLRKHKTLFPCVQFYSSGREAELNWFKSKGGGSGGSAIAKPLASMNHEKRSKKALPLGLADRTGDMEAPLSLGGGQVLATQGVCITLKGTGNGAGGNEVPAEVLGSAAAGTMVSYDVSGQSATHFRCMVGLCDPAPGSAAAAPGASRKAAGGGGTAAAASAAAPAANESKDTEDVDGVEAESKDAGSASAAGAATDASAAAAAGPSATLRVLGDDKVLFESRPFLLDSGLDSSHPAFAPESCVVKLDGCKQLSLVVTSTKPVPDGVHGLFANAELLTAPWLDRVEAHSKAADAAMRLKGNDCLLGAKSGAEAALPLLAATAPIVDEAMGASHGLHLRAKQWSQPPSLMLPFVSDPSAATVDAALELVSHLRAGAVSGSSGAGLSSEACAAGLVHALGILSLQLRRLVFCGVHPSVVGFEDVPLAASSTAPESVLDVKGAARKPGARRRRARATVRRVGSAGSAALSESAAAATSAGESPTAAAAAGAAAVAAASEPRDATAPSSPTAEPAAAASETDETTTLSRLRRMVLELGADTRVSAEVRACAAAVVDDNLPLFFPTAALRRGLVASLTSGGSAGAVEVAFKWPVAVQGKTRSKDVGGVPTTGVGATDSRFERAALLVHEGALRAGLRVELVSQWRRALHLVISVPEDASEGGPLVKLLLGGVMEEALARAGLSGWDFPEGIPTAGVSCRIERLAAFDRAARAAKEPGNVVVRVFPSNVVAESGVGAITEGVRAWLASQAEAVDAEETAARAKGIPSSGAEKPSDEASSGSGGDDDSGSGSDDDGSSSAGSESSAPDSSEDEPEEEEEPSEEEEEEETSEDEGSALTGDEDDEGESSGSPSSEESDSSGDTSPDEADVRRDRRAHRMRRARPARRSRPAPPREASPDLEDRLESLFDSE
ncbi:hypothetical protein FNF28_05347 [Cafeteria roenbergensis]|uniref:SPRY domain-containing protein n=1 Tax=Cafeteria roenbergensis TaxID=33653 RepID=A0A5A8D9W2_CAFRO|nr:hypothetical protein FNF28_05347 [Cafeteria roenbergensis]